MRFRAGRRALHILHADSWIAAVVWKSLASRGRRGFRADASMEGLSFSDASHADDQGGVSSCFARQGFIIAA